MRRKTNRSPTKRKAKEVVDKGALACGCRAKERDDVLVPDGVRERLLPRGQELRQLRKVGLAARQRDLLAADEKLEQRRAVRGARRARRVQRVQQVRRKLLQLRRTVLQELWVQILCVRGKPRRNVTWGQNKRGVVKTWGGKTKLVMPAGRPTEASADVHVPGGSFSVVWHVAASVLNSLYRWYA